MLSRLKKWAGNALTSVISVVTKLLILATFISLPILFGMFFIYLYSRDIAMCLMCIIGVYTFLHLNNSL